MTHRLSLSLVSSSFLLTLAACGKPVTISADAAESTDGQSQSDGAAPDPDAPGAPGIHVNATSGDDANSGEFGQPMRTITAALARAETEEETMVLVAPGTYDSALGETFPIAIPAGISLIGDEESKGAATIITGDHDGFTEGLVEPGPSATLAGFTIENTNGMDVGPMNVVLRHDGSVVRNNTVRSAPDSGIYAMTGANRHIVGNVVRGSTWVGLAWVQTRDTNDRVERNVVVENRFAVALDVPGADLGGGAAGSEGMNVFSCNTEVDVTGSASPTRNNFWDHVPPTTGSSGGADHNGQMDVTGAMLAPNPCI